MNTLTNEHCNIILKNYLGHENYKILQFSIRNASESSVGYLSISSILNIKFIQNNDINEVSFFVKLQPENDYQLNLVKTSNCFKKETAFYGELFNGIREFLSYKSIPNCYLKDNEKIIVFEDLNITGYKTCFTTDIELKHIYAAIKALADIHAASLLYEHKIGKTLDEIFPEEILRPWFSEINNYPGYIENLTEAKIVELIIDKYFKNYDESIKNKANFLCKKYSSFLQNKSKKYRNVIAHFDIWCNNLMFKYDENGNIENCVIIDFQTYGYNLPALDLLLFIHINLQRNKRIENMQNFLEYYYKCLSDNFKKHSVNPNDLLNKDEFLASVDEAIPIALTGGVLFIHSADVPENQIISAKSIDDKLKEYYDVDRRKQVLEFMEKYEDFKIRILQAVEDLFDYVKKKFY